MEPSLEVKTDPTAHNRRVPGVTASPWIARPRSVCPTGTSRHREPSQRAEMARDRPVSRNSNPTTQTSEAVTASIAVRIQNRRGFGRIGNRTSDQRRPVQR